MKYLLALLLLLATCILTLPVAAKQTDAEERARPRITLNDGWGMARDAKGTAPRAEWSMTLPDEGAVTLPHRWQDDPRIQREDDAVWYTRPFTFPAEMTAAGALLVMEDSVGMLEVFLDGQPLDRFLGNGLPRRIRLQGAPASQHRLTVRLGQRALPQVMRDVVSGCLGSVSLELLPAARIEALSLLISPDDGDLTIRYRLSADEPCRVMLGFDLLPDDSRHALKRIKPFAIELPMGTTERADIIIPGKIIRRWSPRSIQLYRLRAELSGPGKSSDLYQITCGVSALTLGRNDRLSLDGAPVLLKGLRLPGGVPPRPALAGTAVLEEELGLLQRAGYNAIMMDGAALPEEALEVADRLGLLVVAEVPPTLLEVGGQAHFTPDFATVIAEIGHHPCIVAWSWASDAPAIDVAALRRLDPYRLALVRNPAGVLAYFPFPASGMRVTGLDALSFAEDTRWTLALEDASAGISPYLLIGTSLEQKPEESLAGQRAEERRLGAVRQTIESVRRAACPWGYFVRPAHGGTLTGLRTADWTLSRAYFAAQSYNMSRIIALRVTADAKTLTPDVKLITDSPLMGSFQLARLLTRPNGLTEITRTRPEDTLDITADRLADLSRIFPDIPLSTPGEYCLQYILTDGPRVLATSQVVHFTGIE